MTRKECLEQAMGCVLKDRNNEYGKPEDCFGVIANFWSVYLGRKVYPHDVAMMMALLKIARIKGNHGYADGYIDLAGYAACGAECVQTLAPEQKPDELVVLWKHNPKATGCEELVQEEPEPEFNPRDRVQAKMGDGKWRDAFVSGKEIVSGKLHYTVGIHGFDGYYSLPAEDIRPAPRAEGCEDLVQKDAPQTQQELYQRIVDCNPATFHTPSYAEEQLEHHSRLQAHKPTGEELAEMAEEEAHE